jgi:hypothetical protein
MTFCVTCVVERIVTTHFLKPLEGRASSRSRFIGDGDGDNCSALSSVSVDSNQNKQVIYTQLESAHGQLDSETYLSCEFSQTSSTIID